MTGDLESRKSITGYMYTLNSTIVSCVSKLQKIVELLTTESKYVAV